MATEIYYFNSGRAITASGGFFDEPIGSACGMPQGGYRKPPARLVVMTVSDSLLRAREEKVSVFALHGNGVAAVAHRIAIFFLYEGKITGKSAA